jgi:predicted phosphodiesterase
MRFGVISDTHGNTRFACQAADLIIDAGAEFIYHLGDDYKDAELLRLSGLNVRMVPGLWCREYRDPKVPNVLEDCLEGVPIACAHTLEELRRSKVDAKLLLFGHTHVAESLIRGGVLLVNPGHLKRASDRGQMASFAMIEIQTELIVVALHELDGTRRAQLEFQRSALGC